MRTLAVLVLLLALSACSLPVFFRVPVVQGNVVTAENVKQLELGMTKRQVEYVMGTPLVDSSFENDRWDYVFYYRDPRAHVRQSELNLYFTDGKLSDIEGDKEYTAQVLEGDTPLPPGTTPGPNDNVDEDELAPTETPRSQNEPLAAPLPGT